jgi:nitrogen regulatory protein PII
MFLLVIILNDPGSVNLILSKFLEIDVRGATVINSHGMGQILGDDIPMFYPLRKFISGADRTQENNMIMSVIRTEETLNKAIRAIQEELNLDQEGSGIMFVLPVIQVHGLANPLKDSDE